MNRHSQLSPTNDEIRIWAYHPAEDAPPQDWDLILSWGMDRGRLRTCAELASDPQCPSCEFFLLVLYQWIAYSAKAKNFEIMRSAYCDWVDALGRTRDPKVNRWRHQARLILQGTEPFDSATWWRLPTDENLSIPIDTPVAGADAGQNSN